MKESFSNLRVTINKTLEECEKSLFSFKKNEEALNALELTSQVLVRTIKAGGKILTCGNGGSMSDAMHMAEEFSGRFRENRRPLAAMALSDPAHMTCVANDFGYEKVFSRMVEALGRKEDCLVAISTSGRSSNIIEAARKAKELGIKVIILTGRKNSTLSNFCDYEICTESESKYADRIQELHIKCIHILLELCENLLFTENSLKSNLSQEPVNVERTNNF